MANVRFLSVKLKSTFNALETKDNLSLYWIDETQELYKGSQLYGTGTLATEKAAGLLSPEDYVALKSLIASSGGVSNLTAVDGTIKLVDTENGGKDISVAISNQEGNTLMAVDGGLFVPTVSVPEYTIEKQAVAEEGYSVSYKLKKIIGNDISYVGDTINIAKDMMLHSVTMEVVVEADVPYAGAVIGDSYIKMVFNDANASAVYIPVANLVNTYSAGDGIEIVNNTISVKIAAETHGLTAVEGALALNLATKDSDGAMSKEDKAFIDALRDLNNPDGYVTRSELQQMQESVEQITQSYVWTEM